MAEQADLAHRFVLLAMRCARIRDVELSDVVAGRYPEDERRLVIPAGAPELEKLVALAKDEYDAVERIREASMGKVSTLLALVAGLAALVPAALVPGPQRWGTLSAGLLFLVSLLLLVHFLAVRRYKRVILDDDLVVADSRKRDEMLIHGYLDSAEYNQRAHAYLVDVYRATLRVFVVAVVVALISSFVPLAWATDDGASRIPALRFTPAESPTPK